MKLIQQFSYRTPTAFRPKAQLINEDSLNMLGLFFSWGDIDLADKVFSTTRTFVEAHLNQSEITNPFGYNESLSGLENALRTGFLVANESAFRMANQSSLSSGAEGVILVRKSHELAVVQIGQPHVFLKRGNLLYPLSLTTDLLGSELNSGDFLPRRLIGTYNECYPQLQSVHLLQNDHLILLAHSLIPQTLFKCSQSPQDSALKVAYQGMCNEFPQHPFWISEIKL